ncbi:hypothetical protein JW835_00790 [bacterium]|nr:hypothetical protein [bacterium]
MGIGDRFGKQGNAQLKAMILAREQGILIAPVWNKSFREHQIIGTTPETVRMEADSSVKSLGWKDAYYVDADHINMNTVDDFIPFSNFFTMDVADAIGEKAEQTDIQAFADRHSSLIGNLSIRNLTEKIKIDSDFLYHTAEKYLFAVQEAGRIYRHIKGRKPEPFVTEVSMDETDSPQSPQELLLILAMIHAEELPVQTIAPKFSGRFNKGVDYVGNPDKFAEEFEADIAVIEHAVQHFGLPARLKLSIHSGSDKFMLYPIIRRTIRKFQAGVHLKTAGTSWLEELIGLAESGGEGLQIAKDIYQTAFGRFDELCKPYFTVIDIDAGRLPDPDNVQQWSGRQYADALRHDQTHPEYNMHFRQLLHVAYKVAAEKGDLYLNALDQNQEVVSRHVTENLLKRHIKPLFID